MENLTTMTKKPASQRQPMPEPDPKQRAANFDEVALGYSKEQAIAEATRCLGCKEPKCIAGCPVEIAIPDFIEQIARGDSAEAIQIIKDKNSLPAICGRVCPQETQCEQLCVLGKKGEPIAIGRLERFVADRGLSKIKRPAKMAKPKGKQVAVVGSGPAGLTAAGDLAKLGYQVTIFEVFHAPGGVLRYGIPEFRLPKKILDQEIAEIERLGVDIKVNSVIGRIADIQDLFEQGFGAVFIATGAGSPTFLGIPGENLNGVYSANEFLTRVNLMNAYQFPEYDTPVWVGKSAVVVGGGNTAMDAVRTARRLGADHAIIVYRRSEKEMPARAEEVAHAKEEGIEFHLLTNPVRILRDDRGWVKGIECVKMELGEPDESGRRRPIPIPGSEFIIEADTVIIAIGTNANPLVPSRTPGLRTNEWGYIITDPETGQTSLEGVYAGGDIVTGSATVIEAMGAGKRAAQAIHQYLSGKEDSKEKGA